MEPLPLRDTSALARIPGVLMDVLVTSPQHFTGSSTYRFYPSRGGPRMKNLSQGWSLHVHSGGGGRFRTHSPHINPHCSFFFFFPLSSTKSSFMDVCFLIFHSASLSFKKKKKKMKEIVPLLFQTEAVSVALIGIFIFSSVLNQHHITLKKNAHVQLLFLSLSGILKCFQVTLFSVFVFSEGKENWIFFRTKLCGSFLSKILVALVGASVVVVIAPFLIMWLMCSEYMPERPQRLREAEAVKVPVWTVLPSNTEVPDLHRCPLHTCSAKIKHGGACITKDKCVCCGVLMLFLKVCFSIPPAPPSLTRRPIKMWFIFVGWINIGAAIYVMNCWESLY
ncbi:hypothetical protein INR49_003317 [Caranx melampygus]|nr:hypothetical protein INR49_003317 [Caranx melampygus]